jgi:predicted Zn-dependent protease
MNTRIKIAALLMVVLPTLAATAWVRAFDLNLRGLNVGKVLDIAEKGVQATAEVPVEREIAIGRGMAAGLLGATPLVRDRNLQLYVNRVGRWIASQTERPNLPWDFGVLNTDSVNAFAAPGGFVFVTAGLLHTAHSESELAGVLAHEIGHVLRRHHLEAIRKQAMAGLATDLLSTVAANQHVDLSPFIRSGMQLYARGLDRDDEFEADRIGVVLATRAGYEPYGLPRVLLTLNGMNPNDAKLSLLNSTHPPTRDRLSKLDQLMRGRFETFGHQPQLPQRYAEYCAGLYR